MSFFDEPDLKCVILCGGKGMRLQPLTASCQKTLLPVQEQPLLGHVIEFWRQFTNNFIFITSVESQAVAAYVRSLDIESEVLVEDEPRGIALALRLAAGRVSRHFLAVCGDCLCRGEFAFPSQFLQGFGVYRTNNPEEIRRQGFGVRTDGAVAVEVIEKPEVVLNDLCGMGIYFFDRRVFDYIERTPVSPRTGRVEITDVVQQMIEGGERITPLFFDGGYVNVTYEQDLRTAAAVVAGDAVTGRS